MKYAEVAKNVKQLLNELPPQKEFVYELLLAYGTPKTTIARLKSGQLNLAKDSSEILLKNKIWFKPVDGDLFAAIEELKTAKGTRTNKPRFLIVTDFKQLVAVDTKTTDTLDIELPELETNFDFFLPWAGMEKTRLSNENPADIKAAEKMAKLFDAIKQDNPEYVRENAHSMNVFLGRLLFCLFAEDTGIFPENAISNAIASHTAVDGSDLDTFFKTLFDLLDSNGRNGIPEHLKCFPYVNGGLFKDHFDIPSFSAKSRRMIIASGELNWSEINPDIFGSMFQAVIDPEERHNLGQHYTSVTNIMKVIEPLFLNDFKADFDKAVDKNSGKKPALNRLLNRIAKVKIFDPACGSGNFLIIAYKELRRLEMEVFRELQTIEGTLPLSGVKVSQFYGIEIADFACETAILALWLAEHQMNLESKKVLGQAPVSLPLKEGANVVCGNATRVDWEGVCPKDEGDEIYVLGNPPYLGARMQNEKHKADMSAVFGKLKGANSLDYIACWFWKGAQYIRRINAQLAFVSTNSICQGEQVALLWPHILKDNLEISFAHQSFKWSNNAKGSAAVICVVVGVCTHAEENPCYIYSIGMKRTVGRINAYLSAGSDIYIYRRSSPLSNLPELVFGNMPNDGGHLLLTKPEKDKLLVSQPKAGIFIRKFVGAQEFMQGGQRWCLWIKDEELNEALSLNEVKERLNAVRETRLKSKREATRNLATIPHRFGHIAHKYGTALIMPSATSERREYVPVGFIDDDTIISNLAHAIYGGQPHIMGLLSSKMHMVWIRAIAGRLKSDYRYSGAICYNNFPISDLTEAQKQTTTMHVFEVLEEREKHPEKTMAQLYDPDKMPDGLREAHHQLDLAVDRLYRNKPFSSDEERLEHLFKLYEVMIVKEKLLC